MVFSIRSNAAEDSKTPTRAEQDRQKPEPGRVLPQSPAQSRPEQAREKVGKAETTSRPADSDTNEPKGASVPPTELLVKGDVIRLLSHRYYESSLPPGWEKDPLFIGKVTLYVEEMRSARRKMYRDLSDGTSSAVDEMMSRGATPQANRDLRNDTELGSIISTGGISGWIGVTDQYAYHDLYALKARIDKWPENAARDLRRFIKEVRN